MKKETLKSRAFRDLFKISFFSALILILITILTAQFFFKEKKKQELALQLNSALNSIYNISDPTEFPRLLSKLQTTTLLQEIVITNKKCEILGTTTLKFNSENCVTNNSPFTIQKFKAGELPVYVFYIDNYSYMNEVRTYSRLLIILYLGFFFFIFVGIFIFLNQSFIKPLEELRSSLNNIDNLVLPNEMNFITSKLKELSSEIREKEREKNYYTLARIVVHDIRNPLAFIKSSLSFENIDIEELKLRTNEIEYHINNLLKSNRNFAENVNFQSLLIDLKKELNVLFKLDFKFSMTGGEAAFVPMSVYDIRNIILNLAKNSSEANSKSMNIEFEKTNNTIIMRISDKGEGLNKNLNHNPFSSKTTKAEGNGIGLVSLKKFLNDRSGDLLYDSSYVSGACFIMTFPYVYFKNAVLIDDQKYIQASWRMAAEKNSVNLQCYYSVDEFLANSDSLSLETSIFVDSDLGSDLKGEILSQSIFNKGFKNIYLSTGYDDVDSSKYFWIKEVTKKSPPF